MKRVVFCSAFIGIVFLTGCMTVDLKSDSVLQPVAMSADINREYEIVGRFEKEVRVWFTLYSLITINPPDIDKLIEDELRRAKGDAVVNLRIRGQQAVFDYLIPTAIMSVGLSLTVTGTLQLDTGLSALGSLFTLAAGQIASRTYTIEGDVVRYKN